MSVDKITTTPTPLALVDKINELVGDYLPADAKAALAALADKATADASGNTITSTYATKAQAITGLSASGKTVTYTKGDGSTGTITTQDTNTTYSEATTSAAGLMSASDKTKLNGIATGANAYSLPTASSSTLGGIKVGSGLSISSGVLSASGGTISASSLGTNGYVKFSNGLILQWGAKNPGNTTKYNMQVNFPLSFTTTPYSIVVHQQQNSGSAGAMGWWYVEALTASSFTMKWQCDCFWIAVGK